MTKTTPDFGSYKSCRLDKSDPTNPNLGPNGKGGPWTCCSGPERRLALMGCQSFGRWGVEVQLGSREKWEKLQDIRFLQSQSQYNMV